MKKWVMGIGLSLVIIGGCMVAFTYFNQEATITSILNGMTNFVSEAVMGKSIDLFK